MDFLNNLTPALQSLFSIMPLFLIFIGICVGIMGGAIPGISPSMAVALLLPLTYSMSATNAMLILIGIYIGANYGGSITAISINTPGTPSATVTSFDGYPMAISGKGGEAMGISLWASVFGGIIGTLILIFASRPLAKLALQFWPSEYFALCIMGLTTVATLGGKHWQKAMVCVLFGLLLNTMGLAPITAVKRFTFGINHLYDGITFVP
ncbi:MAG: C4-dicarboxylate ABC transporter permease, partial [Clostridiales bacterium]|nr:C4-dicarboxylate ABC transporter permease [Clostridiales bacterium]